MFSTPLRSLVAKDVSNLLFAGRLASFSHVVYGSERVMKTCATMGQAAGTAAAYATSRGKQLAQWPVHGVKKYDERLGVRSLMGFDSFW